MAGFLYAIPGVRGEPPADLVAEYQLRYAFESDPIAIQLQRSGPGDEPATILVDPTKFAGMEPGYYGDQVQRWESRPARFGKACRVGYFRDAPPAPSDLARSIRFDAVPHRLGDGNQWLIPLAPALPRPMALNERGEWVVGSPTGVAFELSEIAKEFVTKALEAVAKSDLSKGGLVDFRLSQTDESAATRFLAANYCVSEVETWLLGLFASSGSSVASQVLVVGSDWDLVLETLKKNEPPSQTSVSGS